MNERVSEEGLKEMIEGFQSCVDYYDRSDPGAAEYANTCELTVSALRELLAAREALKAEQSYTDAIRDELAAAHGALREAEKWMQHIRAGALGTCSYYYSSPEVGACSCGLDAFLAKHQPKE